MLQKYKVFYKYNAIDFVQLQNFHIQKHIHAHCLIHPDINQLLITIDACFNKDVKIHQLFVLVDDPKTAMQNFFNSLPRIDAAGGIVTNGSHEWLFIKRAGVWDLPKGKIDEGETIEVAAIREVKEETGISSLSIIKQLDCSFHIYPENGNWIFKNVYWFLMLGSKSKLTPQTEENITIAKWIHTDTVKTVVKHIFPSIKNVIEQAGIKTE